MASLEQFWERAETEPFEWGRNDCLMWSGSYIATVTGYDPVVNYRGTYSTKWGARSIIMRGGGFVNLVSKEMSRFKVGGGDGFAVIKQGRKPTGAIIVDGFAWIKEQNGVRSIRNPEIIKGWNLCQQQ